MADKPPPPQQLVTSTGPKLCIVNTKSSFGIFAFSWGSSFQLQCKEEHSKLSFVEQMDIFIKYSAQRYSNMSSLVAHIFISLLCISSGLNEANCVIPDINEYNELVMDTNKTHPKTSKLRLKPEAFSAKIKVGLCLPEWEKRRLTLPLNFGEDLGVVIKDIDMEKPIEEQGPFDIIFHKILKWFDKDVTKGKSYLNKLLGYVSQYQNIQLVDPIENGIKLANRSLTLQLAKQCEFESEKKKVFVPKFVYLNNNNVGYIKQAMRNAGIQYPIISKQQAGNAGITESHKMKIIFSEENIKDLEPPCVVQEFMNHGGKMFKVYVIGNKYYACEKPSVRNLKAGNKDTVFFDSTNITKGEYFPKLHDQDPNYMNFGTSDEKELLDKHVISTLIRKLRTILDFNIIGIDIIIDERNGNYGIVDLNYSPSFHCVMSHFPRDLIRLFLNISKPKDLKSRV
eukprot:gene18287-20107_t